ncbi:hypothetical protein [Cupriavidus sp. RAF12]|uniref:hypothetical protein n=1 Tax=Cupriavidus sp. RAF12 TaxID=3233050 RepID=UPI003F8DBF95
MKILVPLVLVVALAGCATTPIPAEQAKAVPAERLFAFQQRPAGEYATLIVTRDTGMAGARSDVKLSIGNQPAADVGAGETVRFYLPAGEVIVGAKLDELLLSQPIVERAVALQPGQARRYRISVNPGVGVDLQPTAF